MGSQPQPKVNYEALMKTFAAPPPAAAQPMTNVSSPNPTITKINEIQMGRAQGDMNAGNLGRASDIAIRDNAENERKAERDRAGAMGYSGGGVAGSRQGAITRDVLRAQTGARVGILNDAEARRDNLYGQVAGQAAIDERLQDQQRNTGIRQQQANTQQVESARSAQRNAFRDVMDLFETTGDGFFGVAGGW